jgi:D-arabinose 1-dehydrogenase-like Zn-dependent alcohol dehydrogenase
MDRSREESAMRVAQVSVANRPFELVEREVPEPGRDAVRVAVDACGVCHSDVLTRMAGFPGMTLPRVPGHEVIGRIETLNQRAEVVQKLTVKLFVPRRSVT